MNYRCFFSKNLHLPILMIIVLTIQSCDPNPNTTEYVVPRDSVVNLDIETIRDFYKDEDIQLDEANNFEEINTYGSLISDPKVGNTPNNYLMIQEGNHGIGILLDDTVDKESYNLNEVLQVNVKNAVLKKVDGNLFLTGLSNSDIIPTGEIDSIQPRSVTMKVLSNNFDDYRETLVKLEMLSVLPVPSPEDTYSGVKNVSDGTTDLRSVKLYTFPESKLADKKVLKNSTMTAIAMTNKNDKGELENQIWLRNDNDFDSTEITSFDSPIAITGFLANPTGYDYRWPGYEVTYPGVGTLHFNGGFQYIQFMATKDIDFSETPFSIVTMVSTTGRHGATADGWAAGKFRTAKFDLDSGMVKKGSFFYVGSGETLINGYSTDGYSTDISEANWIYTKPFWLEDYDLTVGNHFDNGNIGHSVKSWLDHNNGAGSDAIAVFEGTSVSGDTQPADAIFFNEDIGGTYDASNNYGFTVPNNDHYSTKNADNGDSQPLFGQGTNTWAIPFEIVNGNGVWVALGGMLSPAGFLSKREPSGVQLYTYPGKSKLSDLEEGSGITIWRE